MPNARALRLTTLFHWLVAATVPAVILFIVPWTSDAVELAKVALWFGLTLAALVVWWSRLLLDRTFHTSVGPFTKLLGLFLLVVTLSWAFSAQRYTSFVGVPGFYSHALLHWWLAGALLWLWTQANGTARQWGIRLFILAVAVVNVFMVLKLFGLTLLPWTVAQNLAFTPLTTSAGILALVSVVAGVLSFGLSRDESVRWRWVYWAAAGLAGLTVLFLDHFLGWVSIIVGVALLALARARQERRLKFAFVIGVGVVLAVAVVGWIVAIPPLTRITPPADIVLDSATSRSITAAVLKDEPVFGTGPESFGLAFAQHRSIAYNDSGFWSLRFLKPSTELATLLSSVGSIGTITWLAFVGAIAFVFGRALWRGALERAVAPLFAGWAVLVVAMGVYPSNLVSTMIFFFLSGLLLWSLAQPASAKRLPDRRLNWAALAFALVIVVAVAGLFFGTRAVIAEQQYQSARNATASTSIETLVARLQRAVDLHPYEVKYFFTLAQAHLVAAQLNVTSAQPDQEKAQASVQAALDVLPRAAKVNPRTPDTFEQIAELYAAAQQVSGVNFRAAQLDALNQAAGVEPNNPLHFLRAGQILFEESDVIATQVDTATGDEKQRLTEQRAEALTRADTFFRHAQTLKQNFAAAEIGRALIQERQGKRTEAIAALETVVRRSSNEVDAWLALGSLYEGAKRLSDAEAAYRAVTQLRPDSTAGFLALAQLYEAQKKNTEALAAYEAVDKLAPGNAQIQEKIQNLKK